VLVVPAVEDSIREDGVSNDGREFAVIAQADGAAFAEVSLSVRTM
jgi:hypothetical protein